MDPRILQITLLSLVLVYGTFRLGFPYTWPQIGAVLMGAVILQRVMSFVSGEINEATRWRSALISGLSLCLLLRVSHLGWLALAVFLAIASKYLIRWQRQHIFNPTNFAIVVLLILVPGDAWISAGQWGRSLWFVLMLAGGGILILSRCGRLDLAASFILLYACMHLGRALWHGDPLAIPMHHLASGGIAVFALFMITDPRTTPHTRLGRLCFAGVVVLTAGYIEFWQFQPNGIFYGLAAASTANGLLNLVVRMRPPHKPSQLAHTGELSPWIAQDRF